MAHAQAVVVSATLIARNVMEARDHGRQEFQEK